MRPPPRRSSGPGPLSWLFVLVVLALALALPVLGAWVASSLVVHYEASRELALAVGLGLSVVFPLAWELLSMPPREPGGARPSRTVRLHTRLLLRTWAVNLVFMVGALLLSPKGVFTALSTRGDWMLPASGGPLVETTRRVLFKAADGVEWAFMLSANPYREQLIAIAPRPPSPQAPRPRPPADEALPSPSEPAQASPDVTPPTAPMADAAKPQAPVPPTAGAAKPPEPVPAEEPSPPEPPSDSDSDVMISWKAEPRPPEPAQAEPERPIVREIVVPPVQPQQRAEKPAEVRKAGGRTIYPLPNQLHPAVSTVPRALEEELAAVAKYLVSQERDPFQRVKALHDYVADRVVYDVEAYRTKKFNSQQPEDVFKNRKGVCAGYANLLAAMGQAVGEEIVTVSGDAYGLGGLEPHAWNAARIEGEWYLIDATWDAGYVRGDFFGQKYNTTWLFTPPKDFLASHIPDDPAWQLLDEPVKRGEALRHARGSTAQDSSSTPSTQPATAKAHVWDHIRIRVPNRPRAEVKGRFHVELDNPQGLPTQVTLHNTQDGSQEPCHPEYGGARYTCTALGRGLYRIQVMANTQELSNQLMAQLEVTAL